MFEHEEIGKNNNEGGNEIIELDLEENKGQKVPTTRIADDVQQSSNKRFMNISFWQTYFDVNQYEIKDRLMVLSNPNNLMISGFIDDKQELYGPFWIATSLIFCLFAFGNLTRLYMSQPYSYEFIGSAASCIYG